MVFLKRTDGARQLKGARGELLVQADLLRRGVLVYAGVAQAGEDIVVRTGDKRRNGNGSYLAVEVTTHPDARRFKASDPYWDILAVVDVDTSTVNYFDRAGSHLDPDTFFQVAPFSKSNQRMPRRTRARGAARIVEAIVTALEARPEDEDEVVLSRAQATLSGDPILVTAITLNTVRVVRKAIGRLAPIQAESPATLTFVTEVAADTPPMFVTEVADSPPGFIEERAARRAQLLLRAKRGDRVRAIHELIHTTTLSSSEIARLVGCTRQNVGQIRKRLHARATPFPPETALPSVERTIQVLNPKP